MSIENEMLRIMQRMDANMRRMETKVVRGFEELGINISSDDDWLAVDDVAREVTLSTIGRSPMVILTDMERRGATQIGKEYTLLHNGRTIGTIVFNPQR